MEKVKKDTIIRTILLALALINQLLSATGHSPLPIENEQVETLISTVLTVAAAIWSWWKNNSFTDEAIAADNMMKRLKQEKKAK